MSCIQLRLTLLLLSYIVLIQISIDVSMLEKKYHQMVGKEKEKKKKKKKREREGTRLPGLPNRQKDRQTFFRTENWKRTVGFSRRKEFPNEAIRPKRGFQINFQFFF